MWTAANNMIMIQRKESHARFDELNLRRHYKWKRLTTGSVQHRTARSRARGSSSITRYRVVH
jgi:hypothetical protein